MKKLINIRGAVASGKTTAVRQFCIRRGFRVENIDARDAIIPVSIVDCGIIVIGDYERKAKCTGVDILHRKDGSSIKTSTICNAIIAIEREYKPERIIYEHMLTSQTCKGTTKIADTGIALGFEYLGVQIYCSEQSRLMRLEDRSGYKAKTKNFSAHSARSNRATEMLNERGYLVKRVNTENIKRDEMWKIVERFLK